MDPSALRGRLADRLVAGHVLHDSRVERAVRAVPRHEFAPGATLEDAYDDRVIRLKESASTLISSLSQPAMIVEMLQQLDVRPGNRILEIGTGSGYTSALLAELAGPGGRVVTVDIENDLVEAARERFAALNIANITAHTCDGALGFAAAAPYDRILLTVCASDIERAWWEQLAEAGKLVLPLSLGGVQKCVAFIKRTNALQSQSTIDCAFVMLRGNAGCAQHERVWSDPDLFLQYQEPTAVDLRAIGRRIASEDPLRQRLGHGYSPGDFNRGGALWLALGDTRFCRLDYPPPSGTTLPALFAESNGHRVTLGLAERDAVALLDFRLENPTTPALFIAEYGNAQRLARRLHVLLTEWDAAGRPGSGGVEITARLRSPTNTPSDATAILERPVMRFEVWMR